MWKHVGHFCDSFPQNHHKLRQSLGIVLPNQQILFQKFGRNLVEHPLAQYDDQLAPGLWPSYFSISNQQVYMYANWGAVMSSEHASWSRNRGQVSQIHTLNLSVPQRIRLFRGCDWGGGGDIQPGLHVILNSHNLLSIVDLELYNFFSLWERIMLTFHHQQGLSVYDTTSFVLHIFFSILPSLPSSLSEISLALRNYLRTLCNLFSANTTFRAPNPPKSPSSLLLSTLTPSRDSRVTADSYLFTLRNEPEVDVHLSTFDICGEKLTKMSLCLSKCLNLL